jgi:hypothetical protein
MKTISIPGLVIPLVFLIAATSCKKDDPFKDEYEPNDSRSSAVPVTLGQQYKASIATDDRDWFSFTIDNGGIIDVTSILVSEVTANLDIGMTLYEASGSPIGTIFSDPGMDIGINLATRGGSFYLEIYSYSGSNKGHYSLVIENLGLNDDYEPDDNFAQARLIETFPSGSITGNVIWEASTDEPNGDWEFFKVLVSAGRKVSFQVSPAAQDIKLQYELFGNDQLSLGSPVLGSEGEALSSSFNNPGATDLYFFIKLGGKPNNEMNGNYSISFQESEADR